MNPIRVVIGLLHLLIGAACALMWGGVIIIWVTAKTAGDGAIALVLTLVSITVTLWIAQVMGERIIT